MPPNDNTPAVLVIAALPPPIHGQSAVTRSVVDALKNTNCRLIVADISPGCLTRTAGYHLTRALKVFRAVRLALQLTFAKRKALYTVVESGLGIVYNLIIVSVCRVLGFKIYLHHHTARYLKNPKGGVRILIKLAGMQATHIVLSNQMARDLTVTYPAAARTMVSHNTIRCPKHRVRSMRQHPTIGFLSNLCREKGLVIAIETCRQLNKRGIPVKLILAGRVFDEPSQHIIDMARLKHGDWLSYLGPVDGPSKEEFFEVADVFLFPTLYEHEAQPLVLLEAMAAGLPIITTDRGYIRELLGGVGIVADNAEDFVERAEIAISRWMQAPVDYSTSSLEVRRRYDQIKSLATNEFGLLICSLLGDGKPNA